MFCVCHRVCISRKIICPWLVGLLIISLIIAQEKYEWLFSFNLSDKSSSIKNVRWIFSWSFNLQFLLIITGWGDFKMFVINSCYIIFKTRNRKFGKLNTRTEMHFGPLHVCPPARSAHCMFGCLHVRPPARSAPCAMHYKLPGYMVTKICTSN